MSLGPSSRRLCLAWLLLCLVAAPQPSAARTPRSQDAYAGGQQPTRDEKESRTAAQKKIDSQLLYALYERRGESVRRGTPKSDAKVDERGRVLVDIRARVSKRLLARVERLGGKVVSSSERYNSIMARFPLERMEALAARKDVIFIGPAAEATTN